MQATAQTDIADQVGSSIPQPQERPSAAGKALRVAGGVLAANRIAFGIGFMAAPRAGGAAWVGRVGARKQASVLTRGLGARDLALGAGALVALARGSDARVWFGAAAVADAVDAAAALLARDSLSESSVRLTLALGGGSALVGAAAAVAPR